MFPFTAITPRVKDLSEYVLRPYLQPDDHDEVIAMIAERCREIGNELDFEETDKDLTDIERYWRDEGGEFMVLTHHGKIVGTLCIKPIRDRRETAEIDWFFFRKEYEGKGLSLILLKWCMQWCEYNHTRWLEVWSSEKRKNTHRLYRRLGFVDNGIRKQYRKSPPQYTLYFEMEITPATYERARKLFSKV